MLYCWPAGEAILDTLNTQSTGSLSDCLLGLGLLWPRLVKGYASDGKVTGLSACTCQLSEVRVGSLAVTQLHSATRKARLIKRPCNRPRGAACDTVFVLVLAKACLRLARAKRDKAHG